MKGKIFFLSILLLIPMSTKALICSDSEQARLRKLASNVTTTYDYHELENGEIKFDVTITNLTNELYIVDSYNGQTYYYNGTNEITLYNYEPGSKIKYTIYPTKENCTYSYLSNKYVNLPYYNKYYKDELCFDKNYTICNKWQNVKLNYDEFKEKIDELGKDNEIIPEVVEEKNTMFDIIFDFIFKYYPYLLIGTIGLGLGVEYIVRKKNDFGF